ncbi:MAG: hypothetical protein ACRECY_13360 [Phyllobacterium sp.]
MRILTGSALVLTVLIAGCTTMTPQERRAIDGETCSSYGFRRNSDGFASCLLNLELDRRAERRARLDEMRFNSPPLLLYGGGYRYHHHHHRRR